ncbi:MAG: PstS family phosphate ABC transporter substrate-binding protein [Kiloniellaceae bacterium]
MSCFRIFRPSLLLIALLAGGLASQPGRAAEQTLRIGGTGAAIALMTHLAATFARQQPEIAVEVLPSLGSSGGIRALIDGAVDIAVSARPLRPAEAAQNLEATPLLRTPFAIVSSRRKPPSLASGDLAALFADPAATWPDGMPVYVILRPESDSDSAVLQQYFAGMTAALAAARQRPEVPVAKTDQDNIRLAGAIAGSLTAATLTQIVSEFAAVSTIPLDGVAPTVENMQNGRYPFYKELIIVRRSDGSAAMTRFIAFLTSERGRRILEESGSLPLL